MTEKEKRVLGQIYNPNYDEELINEMLKAKDLCYEYNNIKPSEIEKRNEIITKILGKVGKDFRIEQPFLCDYGYNISVGDNFYANHGLIILDAAKVEIDLRGWIFLFCIFLQIKGIFQKGPCIIVDISDSLGCI